MIRCVVMLSGGLDSVIAVHLLKKQGVEVIALHFVLPFASGLGLSHSSIRAKAETLGVPLIIEEEGQDFVDMISDPQFGYGKNANPCLDCRIHRLKRAKQIMQERGALFIATGEVIGQRPKSQRRDTLPMIEKRSGLKGLLVRPLCALHLEPTIPEQKGWIDRTRLLAISGRNRDAQLAYASTYGLPYNPPAGGCPLTMEQVARRFLVVKEQCEGKVSLSDFQRITHGRLFKISDTARLIIGRDQKETEILEKVYDPYNEILFTMTHIQGPIGLLRGSGITESVLNTCASLVARYSRERNSEQAVVSCVLNPSETKYCIIAPASPEACAALCI